MANTRERSNEDKETLNKALYTCNLVAERANNKIRLLTASGQASDMKLISKCTFSNSLKGPGIQSYLKDAGFTLSNSWTERYSTKILSDNFKRYDLEVISKKEKRAWKNFINDEIEIRSDIIEIQDLQNQNKSVFKWQAGFDPEITYFKYNNSQPLMYFSSQPNYCLYHSQHQVMVPYQQDNIITDFQPSMNLPLQPNYYPCHSQHPVMVPCSQMNFATQKEIIDNSTKDLPSRDTQNENKTKQNESTFQTMEVENMEFLSSKSKDPAENEKPKKKHKKVKKRKDKHSIDSLKNVLKSGDEDAFIKLYEERKEIKRNESRKNRKSYREREREIKYQLETFKDNGDMQSYEELRNIIEQRNRKRYSYGRDRYIGIQKGSWVVSSKKEEKAKLDIKYLELTESKKNNNDDNFDEKDIAFFEEVLLSNSTEELKNNINNDIDSEDVAFFEEVLLNKTDTKPVESSMHLTCLDPREKGTVLTENNNLNPDSIEKGPEAEDIIKPSFDFIDPNITNKRVEKLSKFKYQNQSLNQNQGPRFFKSNKIGDRLLRGIDYYGLCGLRPVKNNS